MLFQLESLDLEEIHNHGSDFFFEKFDEFNLNTISSINFKKIKKLSFCGSNELKNSASMKKVLEII